MGKDLPEAHKGHIFIMQQQIGAGIAHKITAAAANLRLGVDLPHLLDEVGGVEIPGRLSCNNVIFHWLNYWAKSRFTMSETSLLSAFPANVLVAMPITLPISFMPLKPLSAIMPFNVASTSSSVSICGR